jgi:hypothetical protein
LDQFANRNPADFRPQRREQSFLGHGLPFHLLLMPYCLLIAEPSRGNSRHPAGEVVLASFEA